MADQQVNDTVLRSAGEQPLIQPHSPLMLSQAHDGTGMQHAQYPILRLLLEKQLQFPLRLPEAV